MLSRDKSFPGLGARVFSRRTFITFAFLFGLMAFIAAPGLPAESRSNDPGSAQGSSAGISSNKPDSPPSLPSESALAPQDSPTLQQAVKKSEEFDPAVTGCRIQRMEFFSDACSTRMAYYAFVPQGQKGAARYPVLYLLHGAFDGCTAWKDHAEKRICHLVSKYRIMIVTPDGGSFGWYADSRFVKNNQIETYFLKELIPHVERNFPTNGLRGIAGLSMGGHGAFVLALRNPGVFSSVSSMSGILDITRHKDQWRLSEVFGPYTGENAAGWEEHSALKLIERRPDSNHFAPMLISVSTGDRYAIDDNRLVHRQLEKMKVGHLYRESQGGHDWTFWTSQLPLHVAFHARVLRSLRLLNLKRKPNPDEFKSPGET